MLLHQPGYKAAYPPRACNPARLPPLPRGSRTLQGLFVTGSPPCSTQRPRDLTCRDMHIPVLEEVVAGKHGTRIIPQGNVR